MDYTEEINKRYTEITGLKNYLNDTDYQTLREYEGGEKMSDAVKSNRSEARSRINVLQAEIMELEEKRRQEEDSEAVIPHEVV
ncbi:MAG: hypothetical protein ACI30I_08995 [Parabacteroides sp.]